MANFRSIWSTLGPPWTRRYWGERLWGAIALVQDLLAEGMTQAARAGWLRSATYPVDALPLHGSERRIPRVSGETAAQYRMRLIDAWHVWEEAGTPTFADHVLEPFGIDATDVEIRAHLTPGWTPDPAATDFSRFHVICTDPNPAWSMVLYGAPLVVWGGGGTIGSTATTDQIRGVYQLMWNFKAGHDIPCGVLLVWGWAWGVGTWGLGDWGQSSIEWEMSNAHGGAARHHHPDTYGAGGHGCYGSAPTWGARLYF
jgi:hypothetical protein